MLIFEVHVIFFLDHLDHLIELVHIELANEGGEVAVPEEVRKHLVFEFFGVFDENFIVTIPC